MEGVNPTRRYKWFRPRQAVRAHFLTVTPANWATLALFNNSTGSQLLVVRDYGIDPFSTAAGVIFFQQGKFGTLQAGDVTPIVPSGGALPGQFYYDDEATARSTAQIGAVSGTPQQWVHDFPFWIIEPNWSLVFQSNTIGQAVGVFVGYEAIFADELDYAFEL